MGSRTDVGSVRVFFDAPLFDREVLREIFSFLWPLQSPQQAGDSAKANALEKRRWNHRKQIFEFGTALAVCQYAGCCVENDWRFLP